jgi:glycine betaine/proline transport system substrate-binding protein
VAALVVGFATTGGAFAADIVIGVPNWPSVNATSNVLKVIFETSLGLSVELQNGTNPVIFEAMDKGSMQIHPEVWLPNQQSLFDKFQAKLDKNANPAKAVQGICVNKPAQDAGVKDISDLTDPAKAKLFDTNGNGKGEIFIGATGWASTAVERVKAKSYGYDQTMDLVELDEGVAYSQLETASKAGKAWAGFCYTPHHLFIINPDLAFLTEPAYDAKKWTVLQPDQDPDWLKKSSASVAWPPAYLQPVFSKAMEQKYPQAASVLKKMDLTERDISGFSFALVVDKKDPAEFAKSWVAANKTRVDSWLK